MLDVLFDSQKMPEIKDFIESELFVEDSSADSDTNRQQEQWQVAERVACSKSFSRSQFLSRFLLYVCGRKLQNKTHEITEQQIGVAVFGRPIGYDCGEDNIVRNYARTLRKRLEEYFSTDGIDEKWHISIPRGGYAPVFTKNAPEQQIPILSLLAPEEEPRLEQSSFHSVQEPDTATNDHSTGGSGNKRLYWIGTAFAACFLIVCLAGALLLYNKQASNSHLLWETLFSANQRTFLVPADSGIGILQNLTRVPVHVDKYQSGNYFNDRATDQRLDARDLNDFRTQSYTSVVDLNTIVALYQLPELKPDHAVIRFARDLTMDDLKNSNVILLGSAHSNPWVEIFEKELNFHFIYGEKVDDAFIKNEHPLAGEQSTYSNGWNLPSHRTYAVVAVRPNLGENGWVLLLEGLNMAATQAAADTVLHDAAFPKLLKQITATSGKLRPFELLIETTSLGSQAGRSRILAFRAS